MRRQSLLVCTVAALTAFAVATPGAYARTAHVYESVITEVPAEGPGGKLVPFPGPLETASSMAVFSGDLYVAEHIEGSPPSIARADQFARSPSGQYEFVSQLPEQPEPTAQNRAEGIAFGSAAGEPEIYLGQGSYSSTPGVNVFAAGSCGNLECATFQKLWTGATAPSPFEDLGGVAVDHSASAGDWASGDVFVNAGGGVIDIFETEAGGEEHYVTQEVGLSGPIAVSGFNGDLVVGDQLLSPVKEGAKKGKYAFVTQLVPPGGPLAGVRSVAVDESTSGPFAGEIYVASGEAVYEFSPKGVFLGDITSVPREGTPGGLQGQTEEAPFVSGALAVDPVSHRVFVGDGSDPTFGPHVVDVFGPDVVLPDVVTEPPSNLALDTDPGTGATSWRIEPAGTVNPDSEGEASCWFTWGLTEAFGQEAPCAASVPDGPSPVAVHATLTGLEPDTAYVYRLQAKNDHGTNKGEPSEDHRFTTPGPGLRSESAMDVSSSGASFEGTVAPHDAPVEEHDLQAATSSPTSYFFQYSTRPTSVCVAEPAACVNAPAAPVSVGSGTTDVQVTQHATGLTASTTYHYRLVAMNEAQPATKPGVLVPFYGADHTFTTQGPGGSAALPDGRAWELVSPVDKMGAKIYPSLQSWSSVEGSRFTFLTNIPTEPEPPGAGAHGVQVLASRVAPGRWSSVDINLSHNGVEGVTTTEGDQVYNFFSPDLGLAVAESEGPFSIPEGSYQNERGEWERIIEASPVPTERTPYLRHNSTCAAARATCYEPLLYPEDVTSGEGIEGDFNHGATHFAGATPDARHVLIGSEVRLTTEPAEKGGLYEWSAGKPPAERLSLVAPGGGGRLVPAGFSPDGSRVLFAPGGLYLRDMTRSETVRLDLTENGAAPSGGIGGVAGTSPDLSKVFFTDGAVLTNRSGAEGQDLYVCELGPEGPAAPKCSLTDLTPAHPTGKGNLTEPAEVSRALNVSPDGSYVYFLAKGVQAAGATPGEGERENAYVAHEHEGKWVTSFIASLHAEGTESVISPDGRWLAFSSSTPLTGYDNRDAKTDTPDSEVYLYDAETGGLVCASCNPSGARPIGPAFVPASPHGSEGSFLAGRVVWQQEPGSRSLFDGGRLFFDSVDAVVPQDTNGNMDVYEFEPDGVGSCAAADQTFNAASGGCTGLISSGRAAGESLFMEANANGSDVFFTTPEPLVAKDTDTALDVYDAHECTAASPCASEVSAQEECTSAAACRPAPLPQPSIFGPPSSATFSGLGNLVPEPPARPAGKPLTAAQKLAAALRACRKRYPNSKKRRARCERAAHRTYGPKVRARKSDRRRSR